MVITNLVLSVLVLMAVYGLTWFIVTAEDRGGAVDERKPGGRRDEQQRLHVVLREVRFIRNS